MLTRRNIPQDINNRFNALRATNPPEAHLIQFIRNEFPTEASPEINQIFQILTGEIFQGRVPRVTPNFNFQNPNMAAANISYVTNPYLGNINPGDTNGSKLYLKATEELSKENKIDIKVDNAHKFIDQVRSDANKFGWGPLVFNVQTGSNPNTFVNLLENHEDVKLEHMLHQANIIWGTVGNDFNTALPVVKTVVDLNPAPGNNELALFYKRVKSGMIAERIKGYLKLSDWENLQNDSGDFTWNGTYGVESDGPTMLWHLLRRCNPSTRVGVSGLKTMLRDTRSPQFKHDVVKMTDFMQKQYKKILEKGFKHDDYLLDLYNSLQSVPNEAFQKWITDDKQSWELGDPKTPSELISNAVTLYNNAVHNKTWNKPDPKDAKLIALTTQLEKFIKSSGNQTALATDGKPSAKPTSKPRNVIDDWRKKKGTAKVTKDGQTWYWCPKHKVDGEYDGLYVTHSPENHDKVMAQRKENYQKRRGNKDKGGGTTNQNSGGNKQRLGLANSLKACLLTHSTLTSAQAEALIRKAESKTEDFQ